MRIVTVTCHQDGCGNAGHPITLEVDDDVSAFACGVCGSDLTPSAVAP